MDWARRFLLPANTCAQVAAVVEKRLWPAHSCVSFNGAVLMPVLLSADAAGIFPSMSFVSRSFPSNHMFLSIRSSPLVWGKWSRFAGDGLAFRFITCVVGGFLDMVTPPTASAIHPHVRGADDRRAGSLAHRERFIPTCVGQMVCPDGRAAGGGRFIPTCVGQMLTITGCVVAIFGSSPRAWGRSSRCYCSWCVPPVHPHVRGADSRSPRAAADVYRFIPTCVGQINE